ncbi:PTS sugar transporter subunit IIA [Streptobacillus notomytis]|uniref:PTS sugar transporter subunit IIA n=1 Tax=Streptobacillus notomytis TaxID=1712031 RepID=UPI000936CED1|nr:PTS sugar transporter subunit IIA [Streptobacillus notomytis]
MLISEIIKKENICIDLKSKTKKEILKELISLVKTGEILDEEKLYNDLVAREDAGSTALEHGLAIPHVRSNNITHFSIGLGISQEGVDFESLDNEKTKLFLFIATPAKYNNLHLEALAKIAKIFYNKTNVNVVSNCKSKEGIINLINKLEEVNI